FGYLGGTGVFHEFFYTLRILATDQLSQADRPDDSPACINYRQIINGFGFLQALVHPFHGLCHRVPGPQRDKPRAHPTANGILRVAQQHRGLVPLPGSNPRSSLEATEAGSSSKSHTRSSGAILANKSTVSRSCNASTKSLCSTGESPSNTSRARSLSNNRYTLARRRWPSRSNILITRAGLSVLTRPATSAKLSSVR